MTALLPQGTQRRGLTNKTNDIRDCPKFPIPGFSVSFSAQDILRGLRAAGHVTTNRKRLCSQSNAV